MPFRFDEHQHTEALVDFARGHYGNVAAKHIFGFNRTVGTSYETIFNDGGGVYTFPASAVVMSCVSSAEDTCSIYITGLDANWSPISESVTLTGTTPVSTTHQFLRINSVYVASGTQSGNVTISNSGTTYAYIEAGTGISQACIYSTGVNERLYVRGVNFTSGTVNPNKYLTGRAYLKTNGASLWHFWQSTWSVSQMSFDVPVPFVIPPQTDFALEAKSSSGENEIAVYLNGFVVVDE